MPSRQRLDHSVTASKTSCIRAFIGGSNRQHEDDGFLKATSARVVSSDDYGSLYRSKKGEDEKAKRRMKKIGLLKCFKLEAPERESDDTSIDSQGTLLTKSQQRKSKFHVDGKSKNNEYRAPQILPIHIDVQSSKIDCAMKSTLTKDDTTSDGRTSEKSECNGTNHRNRSIPPLDKQINGNTEKCENTFSCPFTDFDKLERERQNEDIMFRKQANKSIKISQKSNNNGHSYMPGRRRESDTSVQKNDNPIQIKDISNTLPNSNSVTRLRSSASSYKSNDSLSKNRSPGRNMTSSTSFPTNFSLSKSRKCDFSDERTSHAQSRDINKVIHQNLTRQRSLSNLSASRSHGHSSFGEMNTEEEGEFLDSLANGLTKNNKSHSIYQNLLCDIDQMIGKTKKEREDERVAEAPNFIGLEINAQSDNKVGEHGDDRNTTLSVSSISMQQPFFINPLLEKLTNYNKKSEETYHRQTDGISDYRYAYSREKKIPARENLVFKAPLAGASSSLLDKDIPYIPYKTQNNYENNTENITMKKTTITKNNDIFEKHHDQSNFYPATKPRKSSVQSLRSQKISSKEKKEIEDKLDRLRNGIFDVKKENSNSTLQFKNSIRPSTPPPLIRTFEGDEHELPSLLFPEEHLPFVESPGEKEYYRRSHYSSSITNRLL